MQPSCVGRHSLAFLRHLMSPHRQRRASHTDALLVHRLFSKPAHRDNDPILNEGGQSDGGADLASKSRDAAHLTCHRRKPERCDLNHESRVRHCKMHLEVGAFQCRLLDNEVESEQALRLVAVELFLERARPKVHHDGTERLFQLDGHLDGHLRRVFRRESRAGDVGKGPKAAEAAWHPFAASITAHASEGVVGLVQASRVVKAKLVLCSAYSASLRGTDQPSWWRWGGR